MKNLPGIKVKIYVVLAAKHYAMHNHRPRGRGDKLPRIPRTGIYRQAVCFKPRSLHTVGKSPMYQFDGRQDGSGTSVGKDKRNIGDPTKNQNSIVQTLTWHCAEITPLTLYRPCEGHTPSQHPPISFPSLISNLPPIRTTEARLRK